MSSRTDDQYVRSVLAAMSTQSSEERTLLLSDLADQDPELASYLATLLADPSTSAIGETVHPSLGPPLSPRFRILRRIGQGGFGTVYEAFDQERKETVALKVLQRREPAALYQFKREFRTLAGLRHPNLIRFYDLFEHQDTWFFTMELVKGTPIHRYLQTGDHLDLSKIRETFRELVRVVSWLHGESIIHRDIKPENVLIDDSGRLVLLDFGLALHLNPGANAGTVSLGTPAYMAPEQVDGTVSEASDWYSVGVILYRVLTGRLPFGGEAMQVLIAKAMRDPEPPIEVAPGTPAEWNDLCMQLINRDPALRPTDEELLGWFGESERISRIVAGTPLIGRERELETLFDACKQAANGNPFAVDIEGPSGYGKSKLVDTFVEELPVRFPGALLIRGRCYERESVPFKAVDAMMDHLSRQLRQSSPELDDCLPPEIGAVARLFPVLEQVESVAALTQSNPVEIANPAELRRHAFLAFACLLENLSKKRLVVICLDDLHWGDADSAALFQQVFVHSSIPPFVVVASYRSDFETSGFIRTWREYLHLARACLSQNRIQLGPLSPEAATQLALLMLENRGVAAEEAARALASEADGNPLLLEQLAADRNTGSTFAKDASLGDVVRERISRLPEAARNLLEMLAVAGQPVAEQLVGELEPEESERSRLISSLVLQGWVRVRGDGGQGELEIYHEQIRLAILEQVPTEARRQIHLRIAETLAAIGYSDPGTITLQYVLSGQGSKATRYSIEAADAANAVFAFDGAAQFYALALSLGEFEDRERSELYERLARVHAAQGRLGESAEEYLQAARTASDPARNAEMRRRSAEELLRGGKLAQGIAALRSLGAEFNIWYTENPLFAITSVAWFRAKFRVRGLGYQARSASTVPQRELARLDVYWALTSGLSLWNPVMGASSQVRYFNLALKVGEPGRIALGLAVEAAFSALKGERGYVRARALLREALEIGTRLSDPQIIGTARAMDAMSGWLRGRWEQAKICGQAAERILLENCPAVSWQLSIARNARLGGLLWGGEWKELARALNELMQDARDRDDLTSLAVYRTESFFVNIAKDKVDDARRDLDEAEQIIESSWSSDGFHVVHVLCLFNRGLLAIYQGQPGTALPLVREGLRRARRSFLLRIDTLAILLLLNEGTFSVAAALDPAVSEPQAVRLLKRARACVASLRARGAAWGLACALLVDGGIEAAMNRPERACSYWEDAEQELSFAGMRLHAAAARYWRGRLSADSKMQQTAETVFREQGVVSPERVAAMLAPGVLRPELSNIVRHRSA